MLVDFHHNQGRFIMPDIYFTIMLILLGVENYLIFLFIRKQLFVLSKQIKDNQSK